MQHLYLDAVGGVAGDMFAAAVLDTWPDLLPGLLEALRTADVHRLVRVGAEPFTDGILTGTRFLTAPIEAGEEAEHGAGVEHTHEHDHDDHGHGHGHGHGHRQYSSIARWLDGCALAPEVKQTAQEIFRLLAQAEARVHGIAVADVTFHEVGNWDSIADIVSAAWLIEAIGPARWFASPLPMGRGRVKTAHGWLPVPAPATALLLEGCELIQDGLEGERVTPTGAAIVRYLTPSFTPMSAAGRLAGSGFGFGTKRFEGLSNVLRLCRFDAPDDDGGPTLGSARQEKIGVCEFEIDDQTPEDLAHALDLVRASDGVRDVLQVAGVGKKNRLTVHIQVLVEPAALPAAVKSILGQTSTLGVRWYEATRAVLERTEQTVEIAGHRVRTKSVSRPDGSRTVKLEQDDLARYASTYASRKRLRALAEGPGETPGTNIAAGADTGPPTRTGG